MSARAPIQSRTPAPTTGTPFAMAVSHLVAAVSALRSVCGPGSGCARAGAGRRTARRVAPRDPRTTADGCWATTPPPPHPRNPPTRALPSPPPPRPTQAVAAAAAVAPSAGAGLVDNPIVGSGLQYLDGEGWTASNGNVTIGATVPGDVLTDLQVAGMIGDPLYEVNFKDAAAALYDGGNWTYALTFDAAPGIVGSGAPSILLVFDGVKMAADVSLNGVYLGFTADEFLRYTWDVVAALKAADNVLTVTFSTSKDPRNAENRWAACTGGWDWAPYSVTRGPSGAVGDAATFTKGIVKSVSLVPVAAAAITHVVPLVYYNIVTYPTEPLNDTTHTGFTVKVRLHMWAPAAVSGTVSAAGAWGATAGPVPVSLPAGDSNVTITLTAPAGSVRLWWPNGMGDQVLYGINATFTPAAPAGAAALTAARRVGFRVFTLVTGNDTDPSTLAGRDGSGGFTMRYKVNGANMWARGGNVIPVEELAGRLSAATYTWMVRHSAAAGMNAFRLWGGGIYPPEAFYEACDEAGILIYHGAYIWGLGTPHRRRLLARRAWRECSTRHRLNPTAPPHPHPPRRPRSSLLPLESISQKRFEKSRLDVRSGRPRSAGHADADR
jgi:beta-mannosidase